MFDFDELEERETAPKAEAAKPPSGGAAAERLPDGGGEGGGEGCGEPPLEVRRCSSFSTSAGGAGGAIPTTPGSTCEPKPQPAAADGSVGPALEGLATGACAPLPAGAVGRRAAPTVTAAPGDFRQAPAASWAELHARFAAKKAVAPTVAAATAAKAAGCQDLGPAREAARKEGAALGDFRQVPAEAWADLHARFAAGKPVAPTAAAAQVAKAASGQGLELNEAGGATPGSAAGGGTPGRRQEKSERYCFNMAMGGLLRIFG